MAIAAEAIAPGLGAGAGATAAGEGAGAAARPAPAPRPARPRPAAGRAIGSAPYRTLTAIRSTGVGRRSGVSRLLTALAVGAIALEVMSYVTGQYFSLDWRGLSQRPLQPTGRTTSYTPLYAGQIQQLAQIASGQAPATIAQQSQAAQVLHGAMTA